MYNTTIGNMALDYVDRADRIRTGAESMSTEELRGFVGKHKASKARTIADIATLGLTFDGSTRQMVRIYDSVLAER